jgi:hypothetical protein
LGRTLKLTEIEAYRKAYFTALLGIAGVVATYLVGQSFKFILNMASDFLIEFLAFLLFVSAFLLARRYGWSLRGIIPRIWVAGSCSAMLVFTAVTVWNIYVYIGGIGFPSSLSSRPSPTLGIMPIHLRFVLYVKAFKTQIKQCKYF